MGEMRALTVRQPWATAIMWGGKDVENRPRRTLHRGPLLIHAGLAHPDWAEYLDVRALSGQVFGWLDTRRHSAAEVERARFWPEHTGALGVILGVASVVGCHHASEDHGGQGNCSRWAWDGRWHWQLAAVRPFSRPVPCKGRLGLWRLPDEVEAAVQEQLSVGESGTGVAVGNVPGPAGEAGSPATHEHCDGSATRGSESSS